MKWKKFLDRDMSVLFEYFAQRAGVETLEHMVGLPNATLPSRKIENKVIYHDVNELNTLNALVEDAPKGFIDSFIKKCEDQCNHLVKATSEKTDDHLDLFRLYCDEQIKTMAFLPIFPGVVDPIMSRRFEEMLPNYENDMYSTSDLQRILNVSDKLSEKEKEKIELYSIGKDIQSSVALTDLFSGDTLEIINSISEHDELKEKIDNYLSEYAWTTTRHFKGNVMTESDVIEKIKNILDYNCEERYTTFTTQLGKDNDCIEGVMNELNFSPEDRKLVNQIRRLSYLRMLRKDSMGKATYNSNWAFEKIATDSGLEKQDMIYLTPDEIFEIAKEPTLGENYKPEIENRKERFSLVTYGGKTKIFSGANCPLITYEAHESNDKIYGEPLQSGEVTSIARVVKNSYDPNKFKEGDILVTPMTTPDMEWMYEIASGVITDEGGQTCHAAQLSRAYPELPVLIDTIDATKRIPDGAQVYLNTIEGYVKVE